MEKRNAGGDLGGSMRLGACPCDLDPASLVAEIYGATSIEERHRYEVNIDYLLRLEAAGLKFSGMSPDGELPEIVEIPGHPWFVGVQFPPRAEIKALRPSAAVHRLHQGGGGPLAAGLGNDLVGRCGATVSTSFEAQ